jgi:methyl-accepting chemotaxis protein
LAGGMFAIKRRARLDDEWDWRGDLRHSGPLGGEGLEPSDCGPSRPLERLWKLNMIVGKKLILCYALLLGVGSTIAIVFLETARSVNVSFDTLEAFKIAGAQAYSRALWMCSFALVALLLIAIAGFYFIQSMQRDLKQAASQLQDGAAQVVSAVAQVSSAGQSLAQGSSEQAASIQEISASLNEINAKTHQNADAAREAAQLMRDAQKAGGKVREAMDGMAAAVGEIHEANGQIARVLRSIDEIAFQTNILALNAAVEAARAGEAGAGFAVVADEVRNLAQRCATAAKETAQFVEGNGTSAHATTERMDAVRASWGQSGNIRDRVKNLSDAIASDCAEQDRGLQEIFRAVSQINNVTQQTAAQAEETASASEQLTAQAGMLTSIAAQVLAVVGSKHTT